jgi:endonuclease YncB( thermonuclease family)
LARIAILAVRAVSAPTETADARNPIPLCGKKKAPSQGPWLEGEEPAKVVCVVDGDTFDVRLKNHRNRIMRVRLWGVDCPESSFNSKCMGNGRDECSEEVKQGKKVSQAVRNVLGNGNVTLEPPYQNNGNRKLAYVKHNGDDFGRALISSCICREGYSHSRKKDYQRASRGCR